MRIKEQIGRRILQAIRTQFRSPYEAVHELIDNALDHTFGQTVSIDIWLGPKSLVIQNVGGRGMGLRELQQFVSWGADNDHDKDDRGMYGQGGKGAICYLGKGFKLWCRHFGSDDVYSLFDEDILGRETCADYGDVTSLPEAMIPTEINSVPRGRGFVRIEIVGFDPAMALTANGLRSDLELSYRPILRSGRVNLLVNNHVVEAGEVKLSPDVTQQGIEVEIDGIRAIGWAAKADRSANKPNPIKPGFTLYWRGRRVMDGVWFGLNSYSKGSLAAFYGELEISGVTPNLNKTGFNETRDIVWERLGDQVLEQASPVLEALRGSGSLNSVNARDQRLAKLVQQELQEVLRSLSTETDVPIELRKKRSSKAGDGESRNQSSDASPSKRKPRTKVGVGEQNRLPTIIVDSWDQPVRAETRFDRSGTVIAINKNHPAYSAASAKFAIAEGVVIECLRSGDLIGIDDFITKADEVLAAWASSHEGESD